MYTYTTVREIVESLNLEILNEGNLDLKIDIPNIYQIGYELVGFLDKESDGLSWSIVKPIIENRLKDIQDKIDILIYVV